MLLCTTPSSPALHPNYLYIRCVHCNILFPFSLQRAPHLMFAKSHNPTIPHIMALQVQLRCRRTALQCPFPQIMLIKGISRAEVELHHPIFRIFTDSDAGENFNKLQHFILNLQLKNCLFFTNTHNHQVDHKLRTKRKKPSKCGQI